MVPGLPNTYMVTPLVKMAITNIKQNDTFFVLYNPQSYKMTRSAFGYKGAGKGRKGRVDLQMFGASPVLETLELDLFLDTFSAGAEVFGLKGSVVETAKFTGNSVLPSYGKQLDVRTYVEKIYKLCGTDEKSHTIPPLCLTWGSLKFICVLLGCSVEYIKFKETGVPVRAKMHCVFGGFDEKSIKQMDAGTGKLSLTSPDTSKFHVLQQGETLNTLSRIAYEDMDHWREIAVANGIRNPRLLKSGDVLRMPALKD